MREFPFVLSRRVDPKGFQEDWMAEKGITLGEVFDRSLRI